MADQVDCVLGPVREAYREDIHQDMTFVDLGVFNEAGLHVAYHGPYKLAGKIYKEAPWFKEVMKKGFYISDVFLGFRKVPHFIIAILREDKGEKWIINQKY